MVGAVWMASPISAHNRFRVFQDANDDVAFNVVEPRPQLTRPSALDFTVAKLKKP